MFGWYAHPFRALPASLRVGHRVFLVEQSPEAILARYLRVVRLPFLRVHARDVGCGQHLFGAIMDYHVPRNCPPSQALKCIPSLRRQDREVRLLDGKRVTEYLSIFIVCC